MSELERDFIYTSLWITSAEGVDQQQTAVMSEPANPDVNSTRAAEPREKSAEVVQGAGSIRAAEPLKLKTEVLEDVASPKPTEPQVQEAKLPSQLEKGIVQIGSVKAAESLEEQTNVSEVADVQKVLEQGADKSLEQKIEVPEVADEPKASEQEERGTEVPEESPEALEQKTQLLGETEPFPQRAVILEDLPKEYEVKEIKGPARTWRVFDFATEDFATEDSIKPTEATEGTEKVLETKVLENEPKNNEETMRVLSEKHEAAESKLREEKLAKSEIQLLNDLLLKRSSGDSQAYTSVMTVNGCEWEVNTVPCATGLMRYLKRRTDEQNATDPILPVTFMENVSVRLTKKYSETVQGSIPNKAYNKAIGWCSTANNWIDGESIRHIAETLFYYALLAIAFLIILIKD